MQIKNYTDAEYPALAQLYRSGKEFLFDDETDSRQRLQDKITRDPSSILLAVEDERIIGSVSIIEDGRIALLFRLIAAPDEQDRNAIVLALVQEAETILRGRGYKEVHSIGPFTDDPAVELRSAAGFSKGKDYTWFWKRISEYHKSL